MPDRRSPGPSTAPQGCAIPDTADRQTLDWLYQNVTVAAVGGIATLLVIALVLWPGVPRPPLVAWLGAGLSLALLRLGLAWRYRVAPQRLATPAWLSAHRALTLTAGLHFALASVLLFPPGDAEHQALIVVLTAGMVASAVGFHALDRTSVLCFTVPPTLAVAWRYGSMDTTLGWGVAVLAVVFTMTMWRAGEAVRRLVMRNIELSRSLHYLASHDPLVALANRTEFMRRLHATAALAAGDGSGSALLYIDLDHFKALNDSRGHAAGDDALRRVGDEIREALRASDVAARMGGDEFVVLLHPAEAEAAQRVADKLLAGIRTLRWHDEQGNCVGGLDASMGIAFSRGAFDPDELLDAADQACYRAKQHGRGCIALERCA